MLIFRSDTFHFLRKLKRIFFSYGILSGYKNIQRPAILLFLRLYFFSAQHVPFLIHQGVSGGVTKKKKKTRGTNKQQKQKKRPTKGTRWCEPAWCWCWPNDATEADRGIHITNLELMSRPLYPRTVHSVKRGGTGPVGLEHLCQPKTLPTDNF